MRIAHVVRRYGGLTEPFIDQRVRGGPGHELWYERLDREPGVPKYRVPEPSLRPGSAVDRLFHRAPQIRRLIAPAYGELEAQRRPDLIHAHYLSTGYLVGSATRAPLVVSSYGFDVTLLPRRHLWRPALRSLSSRATFVFVEGPHMREIVIALGFPGDVVRIVPIAAHLQDVQYREPRREPTPLRIVSVGRFVSKKGHAIALRALPLVLPRLPEKSTLDIVGSGPLEKSLRSLAQRLGVATRVQFRGALPRPAYLKLLSESDLLVAPSLMGPNGDSEGGAPTTILDAQATGVITLGSTHADIPYLIEDAKTGYLFPEGDAEALAVTLLRALQDKAVWPEIALAARRQVDQRHSDQAVSELLDAAYRETLP